MSLYPLPDLVLLEDYDGDWDAYQDAVHQVFLNEIVHKLEFLGLKVKCRYSEPVNDMHYTFWHLITEGVKKSGSEEVREPDFRCCERIRWIAHILNHSDSPDIHCWENERGRNKNTVLWLPPEKYMVILSKRQPQGKKCYYLLSTAYVHRDNYVKKNESEMEKCKDPRKTGTTLATPNAPPTSR